MLKELKNIFEDRNGDVLQYAIVVALTIGALYYGWHNYVDDSFSSNMENQGKVLDNSNDKMQ